MSDEPPNIDSTGERPTRFGEKPDDRNPEDGQQAPKPDQSGKPEVPSTDFRIPASDGQLDTYQAEQRLSQFVSEGTELPPELVEEQRAVLLRGGDVVADRFEVVKQLGFGGMGAVYEVKDRYLGMSKALKVMLPSLLQSETARARFRSEVAITQQLSHANIVRVFDLEADRKRKFYFFTMELIEGKTLNRLLRERGGKLPLNEALDIVRQICDALEYAHRQTIHRDLKPQNIMVCPDGTIKVLDFGLAKLISPGGLTKSSMALGTAYYQAPEQSVNPRDVDQRADIFSLGVIMYQMTTGRLPLGFIKAPSQLDHQLPPSLDAVLLKCIEPEPEDRFPSVSQVGEALTKCAIDCVPRTTVTEESTLPRTVEIEPREAVEPDSHDAILCAKNAQQSHQILCGHEGNVRCVRFSPDEHCALTASDDKTLKLWDVCTGKEIRTFVGHRGPVLSAVFAPDGTHIISGSADLALCIWETATGNLVRTIRGHVGSVLCVAIDPTGRVILSGSMDSTAKLWEMCGGWEKRTLLGHRGAISGVAFRNGYPHVLTASIDETLRLWESETGRELVTFRGHGDRVSSVVFSHDGNVVLSGSYDGTARLWNSGTGHPIRVMSGGGGVVLSVAINGEGSLALTGLSSNVAKLWETDSGKTVRVLTEHTGEVLSVKFSDTGRLAITGSTDKTARIWAL